MLPKKGIRFSSRQVSYEENLNFNDHVITLASLTLMTGNSAYIDSTVIDGGERDRVILIENIDEPITLRGFTIQNGRRDRGSGGGISAVNTDLNIEDMVIRDNYSDGYGSGISFQGENTLVVRRTIVENNDSEAGAGIRIDNNRSDAILIDVIIRGNVGGHIGGMAAFGSLNMKNVAIIDNEAPHFPGIELLGINSDEDMIWENVTIAGNSEDRPSVSGSISRNSTLVLRNCLIFGNADDGVRLGNGGLQISYSLIVGGEEAVLDERNGAEFNWGEGNIDDDPLFADPDNGNYHLTVGSPCIDAGDPDSDRDPDGTLAEIGAFFFLQGGVIQGFVFDLMSEMPLEGAVINTTAGTTALTNEEGFWQIGNTLGRAFDLNVSMVGYLDSTLIDLQVELEDTLSVNISLLHAELNPSIEGIAADIEIGEEERFEFSLSNLGNGVLRWSSKIRYRGDAGLDPWELRQSFGFGEQLDESRLYGVAFINSLFYLSGSNDGTPTIYIINRDRGLLGSFVQPGEHNRGMKDLAYDGELIWGVVSNTVYGMTLDGEVVASFESPYHPSTAITWDADREILWICGTVSNPVGMDRNGNLIEDLEVDRDGLRIYGLAYFDEDEDNAPLYIFSKEIETNRQMLHKYNIELNEMTFVAYLDSEEGGNPQGAFITNSYDDYGWVFISVANNAIEDRVDIWQLEANTSWAVIIPVEGIVNPDGQQDITLIINTEGLAEVDYPTEMVFTHNGFGLETIIPIDLTVTPLGINDQTGNPLPMEFAITGAYPNPFNSTIRINYTVPQVSRLSIKLYDITGSLVEKVTGGVHRSGQHSITWNASNMPSGIYFARMEAGGFSQTVKLMLMK